MAIGKFPFVAAGVTLADAFTTLRRSNRAGLVVLKNDGPVVFHAKDLYNLASEAGGFLMGDVPGGIRLLSNISGAEGESLRGAQGTVTHIVGSRIVVDFHSPEIYSSFSGRLYYCKLNTRHFYDAKEVKRLKRIPGGWECDSGDNGLVT
jgi:hypothetical protein